MAEREPIPGWAKMARPYRAWTHEMQVGPFSLETGLGTWRIIAASDLAEAGVTFTSDIRASQLAAEDAARALVADMAAALGGTVAWATEGGE